jgi:hypothetical protein
MLIVLAVVTALVALAMPALRRPLAKSELRDAAAQLRVELAKARLKAIESGALLMFRYQPGTGRFVLVPQSNVAADEEGMALLAEEADPADSPATRELAHGAMFLDPDSQPLPKQPAMALPMGADPAASAVAPVEQLPAVGTQEGFSLLGEQKWSKPIFFYPTGRTSNARLRLLGQHDYFIDVLLRGLTGSVKVGEVRRPRPVEEML